METLNERAAKSAAREERPACLLCSLIVAKEKDAATPRWGKPGAIVVATEDPPESEEDAENLQEATKVSGTKVSETKKGANSDTLA